MPDPRPDPDAMRRMVEEFRTASGHDGPVGHLAFADDPDVQTDLAALVLAGIKRATAGLVDDPDGDPVPVVGQHDVVLDGTGAPVCILRTDEVRMLPFGERDPAFAWDEGESDRTLEAWTDIHRRYFSRHLQAVGRDLTDRTEVTFERFSVVWPESSADEPLVADGSLVVRPVGPRDRPWVRTVTPDVVSADGWPTDRCPALLARHEGRTAGVLVFVPSSTRTEVVATALLVDADGVARGLEAALGTLRERYGWGPVDD